MSKLPTGWIKAEIGAFTTDCNQYIPGETETFKYIDISSVNRNTKCIETPQTLLGKDAPSRARKHVKAGDVLVSMTRPNLNAVALVPNELHGQIASTGFDVLRAQNIDPRWVSNLVKTTAFVNSMSELVQGALYPAVRSKDIRGFTAPLAPLNEQKRIADKLDTLLAQVDACRDRLDRIPGILKRFRQSVLAAAAAGNLTQDWREQNPYLGEENPAQLVLRQIQRRKLAWIIENYQHNEVSRVRKRVQAFSAANCVETTNLPDNWIWAKLEDVVLMVVDCHNKTAPYEDIGISLVRTTNIRDGRFIWEDLRYVSEGTYKYWSKRCLPEPGDVVFTREAPMGEAAIIPPGARICLGQRTMLFRPIEDEFSSKFLLIALMDPYFRERSENIAVGTGVKHYRVGDVSELNVPLPPVDEQIEIIRRVESLFAYADRLEARYNTARTQVEKLTPSLLAKAFRGELTADWRAQNPELIRGENSAEALLAKIKAQREADKPIKKPKATKA